MVRAPERRLPERHQLPVQRRGGTRLPELGHGPRLLRRLRGAEEVRTGTSPGGAHPLPAQPGPARLAAPERPGPRWRPPPLVRSSQRPLASSCARCAACRSHTANTLVYPHSNSLLSSVHPRSSYSKGFRCPFVFLLQSINECPSPLLCPPRYSARKSVDYSVSVRCSIPSPASLQSPGGL